MLLIEGKHKYGACLLGSSSYEQAHKKTFGSYGEIVIVVQIE